MAAFGENLKRVRQRLGWSQETLAKKMGLKRPSTIQAWEKGRRLPKLASIRRLAEALGCGTEDLLDEVPDVYAVLRANTEPVLTVREKKLLRAARALSTEQQDDAIAWLTDTPRRQRGPGSVARAARTSPAVGRTARGKS